MSDLTSIRVPHHPPRKDGGKPDSASTAAEGADATRAQGEHVDHPDRHEINKHVAAEHIAAFGKRRSIVKPVIAGVVLVAVLVVAIWQFDQFATESVSEQALASSEARVITTRPAQRAVFSLTDGTNASLAADSRLRVVPAFGDVRRLVGLEGAAEFVVADHRRPFQVRAGSATIIATGTTFAVTAWTPDEPTLVRVREGAVSVRGPGGTRSLAAGEALAIEPDGTIREPRSSELDEAFAWMDGNVSVVERPLSDVLAVVRRWYGQEVGVADTALLGRVITATAPLESSRLFLEAVQTSGGLRLGWVDQKMMLSDAPPASRPRT